MPSTSHNAIQWVITMPAANNPIPNDAGNAFSSCEAFSIPTHTRCMAKENRNSSSICGSPLRVTSQSNWQSTIPSAMLVAILSSKSFFTVRWLTARAPMKKKNEMQATTRSGR